MMHVVIGAETARPVRPNYWGDAKTVKADTSPHYRPEETRVRDGFCTVIATLVLLGMVVCALMG